MGKKVVLFFFYALCVCMSVCCAEEDTAYNRKKIESMSAMGYISFTPVERWVIFFNFTGNSYGPYSERALMFEVIGPLVAENDIDALKVYAEEAISGGGLPQDKKQNIPKGYRFYEKAAELGDVDSMAEVAWYYLRGSTGVKPDERSALKWFIQYDLFHPSAEVREIISKLYSGINPYTHAETNVTPDEQKAKAWKQKYLELKGKTGDNQREVDPGSWARRQEREKRLTQGAGDSDEIMERFWAYKVQSYMRNIEGRNARAASDMGYFIEHGYFSFRRDVALAIEFYRKAADLGDVPSLSRAGYLLIFENSAAKDPKTGLRLLYDVYRKESNYYQRIGTLEQIIRAFRNGPDEIKNAEMAEKWSERKKAEIERVRKSRQSMVHKKWEELTEIDEYFLKSGK